jgi:hypothetical protein
MTRVLRLAVVVAAVLLVAAACSDGVRDSARESGGNRNASISLPDPPCTIASGAINTQPGQGSKNKDFSIERYAAFGARGNPNCDVVLSDWCLSTANYGVQLPDIAMCMVFDNKAARFTSPDTLGANFPLTAVGAFCVPYRQSGLASQGYLDDRGLCTDTSGYRGSVRVYNTAETGYGDQARLLYPNPFLGVGAIQFMPNRQSTGPYVQVQVNSTMAPLSESQAPARPAAQSPFSGSNWQGCEGQGQWLYCRNVGAPNASAWSPTMRFDIGTRPVKLRIINSTSATIRVVSTSAGNGLLVDPNGVGTSRDVAGSISTIPSKGGAYIGGYLAIDDATDKSWTAQLEVETLGAGLVPVTVTFKLSGDRTKNESTCIPQNRSGSFTIKCNTPSWNNISDLPIMEANVTDF